MRRIINAPDDTADEVNRKKSAVQECSRAVQEADREYQTAMKGVNKAEQALTQVTSTLSLKRAEIIKMDSQIKKVVLGRFLLSRL